MEDKKVSLVAAVVTAVLVAAASGFGGYSYGTHSAMGAAPTGFQSGARGGMGGGRAGRMAGSGFYNGTVSAKDSQSITLQLMNGGSKVIYFSASTTVAKAATGTLDDVTIGSNVMVVGKDGTDGTATANSIQVRPAGFAGGPGFGGGRQMAPGTNPQ